ncbi:aminotransferase class I/II-fold pyridoxal phosphate-dependent enzyme [Ancylobacter sp. MQZ15Z-1]|uniref:8-amino-7-oxononanoate synthase n=1 Tax=Ancylobacter mangrovi TaxID=2972472 RepID=A0A9X2T630_9HYPH|nr:aminotransferase class I/II-fold pyridoxal phosphate-dependent enzyme [Ancylobacter mangrovi]MCS0494513.1 aminotransferase class I/II-fold pyridoxal phosphate-dependent enzyme [Ancylobacter mangrovi]
MTITNTPTQLDDAARAALLARMRQRPAEMNTVARPVYDTAFDTLPGYDELRMVRATGEALGIANPFFRPHEGRAGALSRIAGQEVINFASYDYLGLNGHPDVRRAAQEAIERYGTSVSASRLVAGERPFHRELEARLAGLHQAEDAVVFVSGHAANVTSVATLVGSKDAVFHDALIHNSIIVGAELSGAARRTFAHNDLDALERMLAAERGHYHRVLIVVEGLYSMDGDVPDLARLAALKQRFGAWLMVDEAHGIGVLGATGRGIAELAGLDPALVDIWMGTLSKSFASCGGYIAGSQTLIDYLKVSAPGFVYSVGLAPAAAGAALAAIEAMEREGERVAALQANARHFFETAQAAGLSTGTAEGHAIVPIMVGDSLMAVLLSERLLARGVNVLPIIHPAVPHRSARLRFFITAAHTTGQLDEAVRVLKQEIEESSRFLAALGFDSEADDDPSDAMSVLQVRT